MHNDKQLAQLAEPHHRGEAREIAAIDLGSNSFHMICLLYTSPSPRDTR